MNAMTAIGLHRVMMDAKIMNAAQYTKQDKAAAIIRHGLCYLIREIASTGSTFAILDFAREVSRPELLSDPVAGVAAMEKAEAKTPSDVPVAYWAFASDVFYEAGRLSGVIADPEEPTVAKTDDDTDVMTLDGAELDGAEEGVVLGRVA